MLASDTCLVLDFKKSQRHAERVFIPGPSNQILSIVDTNPDFLGFCNVVCSRVNGGSSQMSENHSRSLNPTPNHRVGKTSASLDLNFFKPKFLPDIEDWTPMPRTRDVFGLIKNGTNQENIGLNLRGS